MSAPNELTADLDRVRGSMLKRTASHQQRRMAILDSDAMFSLLTDSEINTKVDEMSDEAAKESLIE